MPTKKQLGFVTVRVLEPEFYASINALSNMLTIELGVPMTDVWEGLYAMWQHSSARRKYPHFWRIMVQADIHHPEYFHQVCPSYTDRNGQVMIVWKNYWRDITSIREIISVRDSNKVDIEIYEYLATVVN